MTYRTISALLVLSWLTAPAVGWANPLATEVFRVRQVPQSRHVQVTYGIDPSMTSGELATPSQLTRDDAALTGEWVPAESLFSANTGSGLVGTKATQTCDCDVPAGEHSYAIQVTSPAGSDLTLEASLVVEEELPVAKDAGVPAGDVNPWDIPEPSEIQGLDCVSWCASGPKADAPVTTHDAEVPTPDAGASVEAGPTVPEKDDSGCALAGSSSAAGTPIALLVIGVVLTVLRRRPRAG
jgi:hypothetical protein